VRREARGDESHISPIRGCTQLLEENHFEGDRILDLRWISQVAHVDGGEQQPLELGFEPD
jgi:hypothetical protein